MARIEAGQLEVVGTGAVGHLTTLAAPHPKRVFRQQNAFNLEMFCIFKLDTRDLKSGQ